MPGRTGRSHRPRATRPRSRRAVRCRHPVRRGPWRVHIPEPHRGPLPGTCDCRQSAGRGTARPAPARRRQHCSCHTPRSDVGRAAPPRDRLPYSASDAGHENATAHLPTRGRPGRFLVPSFGATASPNCHRLISVTIRPIRSTSARSRSSYSGRQSTRRGDFRLGAGGGRSIQVRQRVQRWMEVPSWPDALYCKGLDGLGPTDLVWEQHRVVAVVRPGAGVDQRGTQRRVDDAVVDLGPVTPGPDAVIHGPQGAQAHRGMELRGLGVDPHAGVVVPIVAEPLGKRHLCVHRRVRGDDRSALRGMEHLGGVEAAGRDVTERDSDRSRNRTPKASRRRRSPEGRVARR